MCAIILSNRVSMSSARRSVDGSNGGRELVGKDYEQNWKKKKRKRRTIITPLFLALNAVVGPPHHHAFILRASMEKMMGLVPK
ncbi:hypothetical protein U1Q18_044548 [Sarracenia purpurea var. burkii]